MAVKLNLANIQSNEIPAGRYACVLTGHKYVEKSSSGKPYIRFDFTVQDEEVTDYNGRKLFRNYSLQDQALIFLKQAMVALDCDPELFDNDDVDIEEEIQGLYGSPCLITVEQEEYNGTVRSQVKKVESVSSFS